MRFKVLALAAIVALLTIGIYMPQVHAADGIVPYANVYLWTGFDKTDKYSSTTGKKDTVLDMKLPIGPTPNGIGVRGNQGNLSIVAEVGMSDKYDTGSGQTILGINELSATYNFNKDVFLKFGHFITPYGFAGINPFANKYDFMIYSGTLFDTPTTQVEVSFMGLYIDLIKPRTKGYDPGTNVDNEGDLGGYNTKSVIPRIAVGYVAPMPFVFSVHGVYQKVKIDDTAAGTSNGVSVTSYAIGGGINAFMPFGIIHAFAKYAQNQREFGIVSLLMMQPQSGDAAVLSGDTVKNTKTYGGNVGMSYRIGAVEPGAGIGYDVSKNDTFTDDQKKLTVFASVQYTLEKGVVISPCVEYRSYGKAANKNLFPGAPEKLGNEIFAGIAWEAHI